MSFPVSIVAPYKLSLKLKLLISFSTAVSLSFALTFRWFYHFSTQQINRQTQQTLDRILNSTLTGIDGNDIKGLTQQAIPRADGHTNDNRYWTLVSWLSLIESANPEARLAVVISPRSSTDPMRYLGGGNIHPRQNKAGAFLERYIPPFPWNIQQRTMSLQPIHNPDGSWFHAAAPIRDRQGNVVAALTLNYDATAATTLQNSILHYLLNAFVATYVLLLLLIYLLSELLTQRIQQFQNWTSLIAAGNYRHDLFSNLPKTSLSDELDMVATAFQQMVNAIQLREQKLKDSEASLERQVEERTAQLQSAFRCEAAIRQINYRLHQTLEEDHILKTAVEELGQTLKAHCCNIALYDLESRCTKVRHTYVSPASVGSDGRTGLMILLDYWQVYQGLMAGYSLAFCPLDQQELQYAICACPILDGNQAIGDIWVFRPAKELYTADEIELVEQVTSCCLVAVRQARLHRQTEERLTEMETLSQLKDDFLSTVSHELRTPITNMRMATKMLRTFATDSNRQERYLSVLEAEVQREAELIDDLLDLQKLEAGKVVFELEPIALDEHLPHLLQSFEERLQERQIQLTLEWQADLPPIASDLTSFKRIVSELMNNACKYTPAGEKVAIHARVDSPQYVCLRVSNSGVTLPDSELTRIFDKFYRVPSIDRWKQGGTGLGLALVKSLLEQLGSRIVVQSDPNQVTFELYFPQFVSL